MAVDIDANWYEDQLRGNVYTTAVVCVISLLAGAAIVLFVIAKVRKRFFSISEEMSRLGEDVESLAGELRLASGAGRYNERMLDFKPKYNDEFELLESKLHFIRDELKQYINDHFAEDLNLGMLSSMVGMSPSAFSRFFHLRTGRALSDYIIDIRLGNAARMLVDTTNSISEICYSCGFNNLSNFNRLFKAKREYTPRDFRTLFKKTRIFV